MSTCLTTDQLQELLIAFEVGLGLIDRLRAHDGGESKSACPRFEYLCWRQQNEDVIEQRRGQRGRKVAAGQCEMQEFGAAERWPASSSRSGFRLSREVEPSGGFSGSCLA